jgi:chromosome partitioning protein
MPILTFVNIKGGVAKTTNTVAVAETLASIGKRVLVIDADHQCAASELLLGESRLLASERRRRTLHDLLAALLDGEFTGSQFDDYVLWNASNIGDGFPNLGVLPCSMRIEDFSTNRAKAIRGYRSTEEFYAVAQQRRRLLRTWLAGSFDYTIVDCPPGVPLQVRALMNVSDAFIVPCIPDRLSLRGSYHLMERVAKMGIKVQPLGTVWSMYKSNNSIHRTIVNRGDRLRRLLPRPFKTIIPHATALARAAETGLAPTSLTEKYESRFAQLYKQLVVEIEQRLAAARSQPQRERLTIAGR